MTPAEITADLAKLANLAARAFRDLETIRHTRPARRAQELHIALNVHRRKLRLSWRAKKAAG